MSERDQENKQSERDLTGISDAMSGGPTGRAAFFDQYISEEDQKYIWRLLHEATILNIEPGEYFVKAYGEPITAILSRCFNIPVEKIAHWVITHYPMEPYRGIKVSHLKVKP